MANVRRQVSTTGTVFYQAIWSLYDKDGKRKRQTKAFARQSDARAHAARMEAECERRGVGDVNKQTFAIFKERVLNFWETRGKLSETSLIGYRRNLDLLAREIGHIQIAKLSALHIDEALAALRTSGGASRKPPKEGGQRGTRPLADRTLLHIYRIGSTAMQQAVRWKLVSANPFKEVDAPKPEKEDQDHDRGRGGQGLSVRRPDGGNRKASGHGFASGAAPDMRHSPQRGAWPRL